jgi:hypothetical protein
MEDARAAPSVHAADDGDGHDGDGGQLDLNLVQAA